MELREVVKNISRATAIIIDFLNLDGFKERKFTVPLPTPPQTTVFNFPLYTDDKACLHMPAVCASMFDEA